MAANRAFPANQPPASILDDCERFTKDIVKSLPLRNSILEFRRLGPKLFL
jgi:hypothetical protein